MNARELAERFHEAYERLAPQFGYTTRLGTRVFDPESDNGRLMIAVVEEVCGTALRLLAAAGANDGSIPEMTKAVQEGRGIELGCQFERERNGLAARVGELEGQLADITAAHHAFLYGKRPDAIDEDIDRLVNDMDDTARSKP